MLKVDTSAFAITDLATSWYAGGNDERSARMGLSEVPEVPDYNRYITREPQTPGINRNVISHSPYACTGKAYDVLAKQAKQGYRVNTVMANFVKKFTITSEQRDEVSGLLQNAGHVVYSDTFYDWRGRLYHMSGRAGSLQNSLQSRACLDAPEAYTVDVSSKEWAHCLAVFAHEEWATTYEEACKYLEEVKAKGTYDTIDWMGVRAALAIKEVHLTGRTAYLLEQDATCSGFQHMALLGRDRSLALATNATTGGLDGDLYMEIVALGGMVESLSLLNARKARKIAKILVMLAGYGAGANTVALAYFNKGLKDGVTPFTRRETAQESGITIRFHGLNGGNPVTFDEIREWVKPIMKAMNAKYPVINALRGLACDYFNECLAGAAEFRWIAPGGFHAIRVVVKEETEHGDFEDDCTEHGALPNIIHSLDAAVVQDVVWTWDGVLGVVHDAFFTTIIEALNLRECVQNSYRTVHANYGVNFPIQREGACMPIGRCIGIHLG